MTWRTDEQKAILELLKEAQDRLDGLRKDVGRDWVSETNLPRTMKLGYALGHLDSATSSLTFTISELKKSKKTVDV